MKIYYIKAVRHNNDSSIKEVKLRDDTTKSKQQVINSINNGNTYKTSKTTKVRVIANKYIRTDANKIKEDNLGDLPIF